MSVRFCEDQLRESDVLPFEPQEAGISSIGDQVTNSQREELQQIYYSNTEQSLIPLLATQRWSSTLAIIAHKLW